MRTLAARLGRTAARELEALLAILVVALSLWAFVEIADEVVEGDSHAVDRRILLSLRTAGDPSDPIGPRWFEEMMRDFTALGGTGVLAIVMLLTAGALLLARKPAAAASLVVAVVAGFTLSFALKQGFDRPRPDLVPHGTFVYTRSFPSGHSMLSTLTYLTLAAMLSRQTPRRQLKAYFFAAAILMSTLIGFSRVYLGVHWPTDVAAGWAAGTFWALSCWLVTRKLQRTGQVEAEGEKR
jgi:undecaprenyl-diphosphatase